MYPQTTQTNPFFPSVLKCGVGLNFVRQLEQGKPTLRMDKVNQVLAMFGYELAPVRTDELNEKS